MKSLNLNYNYSLDITYARKKLYFVGVIVVLKSYMRAKIYTRTNKTQKERRREMAKTIHKT